MIQKIRIIRVWFIGILLTFVLSLSIHAQINTDNLTERKENKASFKSKLFFGGSFGLQFGNTTLVELSPLIGYNITPKFGVGISPTYKYYSVKNYYTLGKMETNVWGGSIFARYMVFRNVFAHAEYEPLFYKTTAPGYETTREQFNSFLVGGGFQQSIGRNAGLYVMVLWNLNDTYNSPYTNPIFRIGFNVGL